MVLLRSEEILSLRSQLQQTLNVPIWYERLVWYQHFIFVLVDVLKGEINIKSSLPLERDKKLCLTNILLPVTSGNFWAICYYHPGAQQKFWFKIHAFSILYDIFKGLPWHM